MPMIGADLSRVTTEDMQREAGAWRALPEGEYRFVIIDSDYRPTKAGNGMVLELKFKCQEMGHTNVELRDWLTLQHPNEDTVRIAQAKLKKIAIAVGHPSPDYVQASEELHSTPLICKIACVEADDPKYGDVNGMQNRIVNYLPTAAAAAGLSVAKPAAESSPPPADDEPPMPTDDDIPF